MNLSAPRTLGGLLARRAQTHAASPFVHFAGTTITYGEFDARVTRAAAGLLRLGVTGQDRICIALPNGLDFLIAWFAAARAGAIEVPIGLENRSAQVAYILADCGAKILVTDAAFLRQHREAIHGAGLDRLVIAGEPLEGWEGPAPLPFVDLAATRPAPALFPDVQAHDGLAIIYTSGTTGDPKGVLLCHEHELTLAENIAGSVALSDRDCFYNFFPLHHNTGQAIITGSVLAAGARMLLVERFSRTRFWPDVQKHGCTIFYGMGPILEILNKDPEGREAAGGHDLRVAWGIAIGAEQAARFRERFGVGLVTGYGSTEANMVAISDPATPPDAAGRVLSDFEIGIVDADDRLLPHGEVGEIVVRPRRPFITALGYWRKEGQTLESWRNLWLHTGDAGTLDDAGLLRFVDRIKDVVRHRGNNISSAAVENVILTLSEVDEVAVVPAPSELGEYDQEVRAVIVPRAGCTVDPAAVVATCLEHLPAFAAPRFIDMVAELPKTPTGKVRKVELRRQPPSAQQWDRERAGPRVRAVKTA